MALDPRARYETVPALQAEIEAYQNGFATRAEKAGAWKQLTLLVKRNKAAAVVGLVMILLNFAFTAKVITEGRRAERALADLRSAAPTLISQARELIDQQKVRRSAGQDRFRGKVRWEEPDYIICSRPKCWRRPCRFDKAAAEFRRVLEFGPESVGFGEPRALQKGCCARTRIQWTSTIRACAPCTISCSRRNA